MHSKWLKVKIPREKCTLCLDFANDVFPGIHQAYYNQLTFFINKYVIEIKPMYM